MTVVTTELRKSFQVEVLKADASLGLVFGRAIICTKKGKPYFDTQGDHCPEDTMMKAALDFMESSAEVDVQHDNVAQGTIVFAMPLTAAVAKQFGITTNWTGLMVAARPSPEVFKRVVSGELRAFSIGGVRGEDDVVEEDD